MSVRDKRAKVPVDPDEGHVIRDLNPTSGKRTPLIPQPEFQELMRAAGFDPADHMKFNFVTKMAGRVVKLPAAPGAVKAAIPQILAEIKKANEERGERHDILKMLGPGDLKKFDEGYWQEEGHGKFKVFDLVENLLSKGYSEDKPAPDGAVDQFIAEAAALKEKIAEFRGETEDTDAPKTICQAGRHRGPNPEYQPLQAYKLKWDNGKLVGRDTHRSGGGFITVGTYLLNDKVAWETISQSSESQLAGDLMELAKESYRAYCRHCQESAKRDPKVEGKLEFRTYAGVLAKLKGMKNTFLGVNESRDFESGSARRPREERGRGGYRGQGRGGFNTPRERTEYSR